MRQKSSTRGGIWRVSAQRSALGTFDHGRPEPLRKHVLLHEPAPRNPVEMFRKRVVLVILNNLLMRN